MTKVKILYWDIETSDMDLLVSTYQLKQYNAYLNHKDIVRDWTMYGAAWSWMHEKKITGVAVDHKDPFNDENVIRVLHAVLDEADILVGHNSDKFDLKKFNTRCAFYGLTPVRPWKTIDTIKIARQTLALPSYSMAYIADFFGMSLKSKSPDWQGIKRGEKKAVKYMAKYNKQDIKVGKEIYLKLRPFHKNHPDLNALVNITAPDGEQIITCNACLSPDVSKNGHRFLNKYTRKKQIYLCNSCGYTFPSKFSTKVKE